MDEDTTLVTFLSLSSFCMVAAGLFALKYCCDRRQAAESQQRRNQKNISMLEKENEQQQKQIADVKAELAYQQQEFLQRKAESDELTRRETGGQLPANSTVSSAKPPTTIAAPNAASGDYTVAELLQQHGLNAQSVSNAHRLDRLARDGKEIEDQIVGMGQALVVLDQDQADLLRIQELALNSQPGSHFKIFRS